jgi:hypothetical protein
MIKSCGISIFGSEVGWKSRDLLILILEGPPYLK